MGVYVWVVPYVLMMANPLHLITERIVMFNRLTNKQCAILLAIMIGLFGPIIVLLMLNLLEWLIGSFTMSITGAGLVGYFAYRVLHEINPDNDEELS